MFSAVKIFYDTNCQPQTFIKPFEGKIKKCFIDAVNSGRVVRDDNASLVIELDENRYILKLVKPRTIHEYIKLLWASSRANKEVQGNHLLEKTGISVPGIIDYGYGFVPPVKAYRFIGFIKMENLLLKGFDDSRNILEEICGNEKAREKLFANFCVDVIKMRDNRIVFNDLKLGNIFSNTKGDLIWIDTGVSRYGLFQTNKFKTKHNFSVRRFIKRHEQLLTDSEKEKIAQLLLK